MFELPRFFFNLAVLNLMRSKTLDRAYRKLTRPWNFSERNKVSANQAVAYLNQLLELEPETIASLFDHRVPCGESLSHHSSVPVWVKDGQQLLGPLGILNGLFSMDKDQSPPIIAEYNEETGKLSRFWHKEDWEFQMKLVQKLLKASEKSEE